MKKVSREIKEVFTGFLAQLYIERKLADIFKAQQLSNLKGVEGVKLSPCPQKNLLD